MIQKVMFYLFFFQTDFLEAFCKSYGEQPGYLVGGGRGRIMVFCTLLWDVEWGKPGEKYHNNKG